MEKTTQTRDFPGWGTAERIDDIAEAAGLAGHTGPPRLLQLGQWKGTAICGSDITSSCLYLVALCTAYAGPYAPLAPALVALVLYVPQTFTRKSGPRCLLPDSAVLHCHRRDQRL